MATTRRLRELTPEEKEIFTQIGRRLRQLREEKGFTIGQLVKIAKDRGMTISSAHLSQVENGRANQSIGFLVKVAQLMDMDPKELLNYVISPQALDDLRSQVRVVLEELIEEYGFAPRETYHEPAYARAWGPPPGYRYPAPGYGQPYEERFERLLNLLDEELQSRGIHSRAEREEIIDKLLRRKAR